MKLKKLEHIFDKIWKKILSSNIRDPAWVGTDGYYTVAYCTVLHHRKRTPYKIYYGVFNEHND